MRHFGFVCILSLNFGLAPSAFALTTWYKREVKIECPQTESTGESFTLTGLRSRKGWSFEGHLESAQGTKAIRIDTEFVSLEIYPGTERVKELEFSGISKTDGEAYQFGFIGSEDESEEGLLEIRQNRFARVLICTELDTKSL